MLTTHVTSARTYGRMIERGYLRVVLGARSSPMSWTNGHDHLESAPSRIARVAGLQRMLEPTDLITLEPLVETAEGLDQSLREVRDVLALQTMQILVLSRVPSAIRVNCTGWSSWPHH